MDSFARPRAHVVESEELTRAQDKAGWIWLECRELSSLCQSCLQLHLSQQRYQININAQSRSGEAWA